MRRREAFENRKPRVGNFDVAASHAEGILAAMECVNPIPGRYRIAIHRAKGCYFAQVIDLPGCFARGASEVEAVENARGAIRAYLWAVQLLAGEHPTVHLEISA